MIAGGQQGELDSAVAEIHPTSVVDKHADLADDVRVGPNCVIEGKVVLGAGTRLIAGVYLNGPITCGAGNTFYPFCCIGFAPQHLGFDPAEDGSGVLIGAGNCFREGVTITRAMGQSPTTIGDHNYMMANTHAGHDAVMADHCVLGNGALLGGYVTLGDRVVLGGIAGIHQFCRAGRLAMLSGGAGITKDLPPFCTSYMTRTVGSLNLVGLRRAGYRDHVKPLQHAFDILYRQGRTNTTAGDMIEKELGDDPLCSELAQFVRGSKRGITSYARSRDAAAEQ